MLHGRPDQQLQVAHLRRFYFRKVPCLTLDPVAELQLRFIEPISSKKKKKSLKGKKDDVTAVRQENEGPISGESAFFYFFL
jgi:hypothetical protein